MNKLFIYWDESGLLTEAQRQAEERAEEPDARHRVKIHRDNLLRLAHADRPVECAFALSASNPEIRLLWNRLEAQGAKTELSGNGAPEPTEQKISIQLLENALDYMDSPGTIVLMAGDGSGPMTGTRFREDLERIHRRGWRVEMLAWARACNQAMRNWVEENGIFVPLDPFYESITRLEPGRPGKPSTESRSPAPLDLALRPVT